MAAAQKTGSVPRFNWSGNFRYSTDVVFEPTSVAEVQDAVRSVPHLRALGTRHSFNGMADSATAQISTLGLRDAHINAQERTVRVGAGLRYGDLAVQLDHAGLALHNMASLPHISIAGAVATATHGSGLRNRNLASVVTALELVTADGEVREFSRSSHPHLFPGVVVSLGALGIVTHLTLAVEPRYDMVQTVYENLSFSQLEQHLGSILSAGYSVSLFTDWQGSRATQVWIKHRLEPGVASTHSAQTYQPAPTFFGATRATTPLHPLPGHSAAACTEQGNTPGAWFDRLPHFRLDFTPSSGAELQSEYFVPLERGYEAIRAVETLRDRITPLLQITELRAVAADDLWLSMQSGQGTLAIHFTWKPLWDAVLDVVPAIEAKLAPFGARPHWGKVFTTPRDQMLASYPKARDFIALARSLDPTGKFRNAYLDLVLGDR